MVFQLYIVDTDHEVKPLVIIDLIDKQVDILISKNQVMQILYHVAILIIYGIMIQY